MFTDFPAIEFSFNNSGANAAIIQYVQATWAKFGITATINTEAWATLQTKLKAGDAEAARMGWIADYNDVTNFLDIFISASGNNYPRLGRDLGEYAKLPTATKDAGLGAYWGLNGDQTWADAYDALVNQIKAEPIRPSVPNLPPRRRRSSWPPAASIRCTSTPTPTCLSPTSKACSA